jgi:hypothetical protein
MKHLLNIIAILFPVYSFCQTDTMPSPIFNISIWNSPNKGIVIKEKGEIKKNNLPIRMTISVSGDENYCKKYPVECTYRVLKSEIVLTDKYGKIKNKLDIQPNSEFNLTSFMEESEYYDKVKIICYEVERMDRSGKWQKINLNKEIVLTVK